MRLAKIIDKGKVETGNKLVKFETIFMHCFYVNVLGLNKDPFEKTFWGSVKENNFSCKLLTVE